MPLEVEQRTYDRELSTLIKSAGKFALVEGERVVGVYDTYDDALKVGYDSFGLKPFMVKRIEVIPTAHCFTRDLDLCRT